MSIFDQAQFEPTPQQGAMRVRRILQQAFIQIENSLMPVRRVIERHGRKEIDKALGKDAKDMARLYDALKSFVQEHKPDSTIADLPK